MKEKKPIREKSDLPHVRGYTCTLCHQFFPYEKELLTCPACGEKGILDIEYDYDVITKKCEP